MRRSLPKLAAAAVLVTACSGSTPVVEAPLAVAHPPPATLRRLTQQQYANTIHDILGDSIVIGGALEPDVAIADFLAVGAAQTSISEWGVEQYETLAYDIARQALSASGSTGSALIPCQPAGVSDDACAQQVLAPLGRRLYRRPLSSDELTALAQIADTTATTLADFNAGLQFALATLLQAEDFLFRVELGAPDPATGGLRFTGWEMASRLSYFLWNGPPDDALLSAAASGALDTAAGVAAQVDRLLAAPQARRGLRAFVGDSLQLYLLDGLGKDPQVFTSASPTLWPAAREQTLADFERLVFDEDGDLRDIMISRQTTVDRDLAALYDVRAPSLTGFAVATLPDGQPRLGLLGQASFLALQAHPTTTSPTLRGKFIRTELLCQNIPPPPVNLNTGLPEPSPGAQSLRQRLMEHQQNPACAGCHKPMDGVGLGLETFDGIGAARALDNGVPIDASGELDGTTFSGPEGLAQAVHDHPDFAPCFARRLYRYAVGHQEVSGEEAFLQSLAQDQMSAGYKVQHLLGAIARSDAFRRAGSL